MFTFSNKLFYERAVRSVFIKMISRMVLRDSFRTLSKISTSYQKQLLSGVSVRFIWLHVFFHVTYVFQSESRLYSCLNVKKLFARSRRKIWSLSNCNWTPTHKHLVRKRTLNHLAKLAKWLSCVVSTYLYSAFDCMFLSFHVRVSECGFTLKRVCDMTKTYS